MEWIRAFPGADAGLRMTAPPGRVGQCLEVFGAQPDSLIGCCQELESLPPFVATDGFPPVFQRVIEIDLGHLSASTVPDIVPYERPPPAPPPQAGEGDLPAFPAWREGDCCMFST